MKRLIILLATLAACTGSDMNYDAAGTFEAVETIVSAEVTGTLEEFKIEEGQPLAAGAVLGYIDTTQLYLQKRQLMAQARAVTSRQPNINAQVAALQEQLKQAQREQQRIANLVKADAATGKQLDDANAQVAIIQKQIAAQQSSLGITTSSLAEETTPIEAQILQIENQLAKSRIVNPVGGTVLAKYAEAHEVVNVGKPLYKIADISTLHLRAYVTGNQFAGLKLNQTVTVLTDDGTGHYRKYPGIIIWISDKAEFTPKTIQTKDERANLVYAIKVKVKNDGYLKIGMYGEVNFNDDESSRSE